MRNWTKVIFTLAFAGLLFSGYLSAVKIITGTCALRESCPYFLGYPACWYGFAMYLTMFILTGVALFGKISIKTSLRWDSTISFLGIIFSGSFVIEEILQSRATGVLGFSTCVYGFIFYVAIFILSLFASKRQAAPQLFAER